MPDLGGRAMSDQHARNTARVLSEIDPDFIRMRPFVASRAKHSRQRGHVGEIGSRLEIQCP